MANLHVAITGKDRKHLTALRKHRIVIVGYREDPKTGIVVDAYILADKLGLLQRKGYGVEVLEDVSASDPQRQQEGRDSAEARLKRGRYGDVIWGGGYLSVEEVEGALELGAQRHADYFQRFAVPHKTWEGRTCHAARISKGKRRKRVSICFLSGVHGREWGGPDILIYFAMRLLRAYRDGTQVRFGHKVFTPTQIREIVETKEIILFPQINPDGRHFSMERSAMWRKNRRPAPKGRGERSIGVDLNRNFPILWDYKRQFAKGSVDSSDQPSNYESYAGPSAASEPETKNVIWLLDQNPGIRYLVDLHSYGETILHSWGTDQNQHDDPEMNFLNPRYDGLRGRIHDDGYREYIPAKDQKLAIQLGTEMADAISKVRGRKYSVKPSVGLYPTSGGSDDYCYSRHMADPAKGKIIAYTMEWGRNRAVTPFHPPYPEMRKVMREVAAGLFEFCLRAT